MSTQNDTRISAKPETFGFVVNRAKDAEYETDGLREEFAYRDLGVAGATQGMIHGHIIKAKHLEGGHNGLHRHIVDWQFVLVLKGWVSFNYEDHGLIRYEVGDAVTIPGSTLHELRDYSGDLELLEMTLPAVYHTVKGDGSTMPTPGQKVRIDARIKSAAAE